MTKRASQKRLAGRVALVAGATRGGSLGHNEPQGADDGVLVTIDAAEQEITDFRQYGTEGDDSAISVVADAAGSVYVCGYVEGAIEGDLSGPADAFVAKLVP